MTDSPYDSHKAKVHKEYFWNGTQRATTLGLKLGLQLRTLQSWISSWNQMSPDIHREAAHRMKPTMPRRKKPARRKKAAARKRGRRKAA